MIISVSMLTYRADPGSDSTQAYAALRALG
jgi:hypothetical protein